MGPRQREALARIIEALGSLPEAMRQAKRRPDGTLEIVWPPTSVSDADAPNTPA